MRVQVVVLASLLTAVAAHAQSLPAPSQASDSWNVPAPASTAPYRADAAVPARDRNASSHFKFKERRSHTQPPSNAAQQRSGKAAVGAMGTLDRNGRPAVNCPQTPMDPACH